MTLRSETSAAFRELNERVDAAVRAVAQAEGLRWSVERHDVFPATENDSRLQDRLEQLCTAGKIPFRYLDVPFRWSEDFGHYGQYLPACFFGIGAGTGTAPLHTRDYAWPDLLAPQAAELFLTLVSGL